MKAEDKNNNLISEDILPITSKNRTIGGIGFANIWIGMAIVISVFSFGASGIDGMSIWGVASATLVANIIIAIIGSLTGDIGVEHGLSFATYLRAPFGLAGSHFPSVARGVIASCWFGINTYIGAVAINYFTLALFGIDNWMLWFIVFAIVQVVNTMLGMRAIDKFASLAAPCIILITCWMFYKVNAIAALNNIHILGYVAPHPTNTIWLVTMCANIGMWAALAADIPNMTRSLKAPFGERNWLKRNINNWLPQFLTLPIIETFIAVIGAIAYLTTGNWNPVEVIQLEATGPTLLILLIMVILAQWSTNTAANLVPPAMCFTNAGAKWKLPYKAAVVIAGLIGTCIMPWKILNMLYTYLGYFGSILAGIAAIMICDYYVIRHRRLNVRDLYKADGQYRYHGGFNLAGLAAWAASIVVANLIPSYGYLCGFPTAFVLYYIFTKVFYLNKFPQAEVTSDYSDAYLGISVGHDWMIETGDHETTTSSIDLSSELSKLNIDRFKGGAEYLAKTGNNLVITVGRQYGARGKELARFLGKKLDIPVYDEDLIRITADKLGVSEESLDEGADEKPRNELAHALTAGIMYAAKGYESSETDKVFRVQSQVIHDLALKSSCIIVGRCGNYVLKSANIPSIDIFVSAGKESRVRRIAERQYSDVDIAREAVDHVEKRRESYYNYYTSYEWGKPQYYDLCVNTDRMSLEDLVNHIIGFINI